MKAVFMGTPDFAVPCLQKLLDMDYDVAAVVTQPDKPKGRGHKMTFPAVKELALEYNLVVEQPQKVKKNEEFIQKLKNINPDIIVVVAYGKILPKAILDIPRYGCINVHGSLLPKYRGSAPIQWSVINGEKKTGVTTMYMDEGMDTGDMILKSEIDIADEDTAETVFNKLSLIGAELLEKTLKCIEKGEVPREKQDEQYVTYAPMIDKTTGLIDWNKSAEDIFNLVRGTTPWPGAFTFYKDKMFKVFNIKVTDKTASVKPGEIVSITDNGIEVACADFNALIPEIQVEGKKRMNVRDYIRGNSIDSGEVLSSTRK